MADVKSSVCCMCGDIGFPDKLFRCNNCLNRFQHSYCSNYCSKSSEMRDVCNWCQSELQNSPASSNKANAGLIITKQSEYSGDKARNKRCNAGFDQKGKKPATGVPSPRTATRRYKLLKDVMC